MILILVSYDATMILYISDKYSVSTRVTKKITDYEAIQSSELTHVIYHKMRISRVCLDFHERSGRPSVEQCKKNIVSRQL